MLSSRQIRFLCAGCFSAGVFFSLLLLLTLWPFFQQHSNSRAVSAQGLVPAKTRAKAVPPCGRIESIKIPLANPDGIFPDRAQRLAAPRWFFENVSAAELTEFLNACELQPEQKLLLDSRAWTVASNGITVAPPAQLIWSLTPQCRAHIYARLAKSPANFPQRFPFRFPAGAFEDRFSHSQLPLEQIKKIKRLTYNNSGYLCFTDLQAVKEALSTDEFNDLIATLYQLPTYILRLCVTPESNVDDLIKYWGKGGREKLIAPLLNSLAKTPGGTAFNISFFLPTFARLRLYTYPYTWDDRTASRSDCFFTSMNFFNATADTNFFDHAYTSKVLRTDYTPVEKDPSFGDIVALSTSAGEIFHTCVYIAEDFVFTKNGADPEQPWVLMKLPDMLILYFPTDRSGQLSFFRRKDLS